MQALRGSGGIFVPILDPALGNHQWSAPHPAHFTPKKEMMYPSYRGLGGPRNWSGWVCKISSALTFKPRNIQPLASHYTDFAIPSAMLQDNKPQPSMSGLRKIIHLGLAIFKIFRLQFCLIWY